MEENLHSTRVPVLWVGRCVELPHAFHVALGVFLAVGLWTPIHMGWTRPSPRYLVLAEARDNQFSVSGIPDAAGHLGRAENKVEAPGGGLASLRGEEMRGHGERGHWVFPMKVRVFSSVSGWSTGSLLVRG